MNKGDQLVRNEPGILEIFMTVILGTLLGGTYREYADRLSLKGSESVLDFGAGSGNLARFIAPRLIHCGGRLTWVDISKKWMDVARWSLGKYPNVDFKLGDIARLDIPDESCDVIVIHFVLHDIDAANRPRITRNLVLKLKEDGTLFIREPMRFISQDEISQLMRQNGLEEIESQVGEIKSQGHVYEGVFRKAVQVENEFCNIVHENKGGNT